MILRFLVRIRDHSCHKPYWRDRSRLSALIVQKWNYLGLRPKVGGSVFSSTRQGRPQRIAWSCGYAVLERLVRGEPLHRQPCRPARLCVRERLPGPAADAGLWEGRTIARLWECGPSGGRPGLACGPNPVSSLRDSPVSPPSLYVRATMEVTGDGRRSGPILLHQVSGPERSGPASCHTDRERPRHVARLPC